MLLEERIEYLHDLMVGKDFLELKKHELGKKNSDLQKGHQNSNSAHQKISFRE